MRCGRGPCPLDKTVGRNDISIPAAGKPQQACFAGRLGSTQLNPGEGDLGKLARVTEQTSGFPVCVDVSPSDLPPRISYSEINTRGMPRFS